MCDVSNSNRREDKNEQDSTLFISESQGLNKEDTAASENSKQNVNTYITPAELNKGRTYAETPFTFNKGSNDGINLNSGAMSFEDTVARIPGRNGLDLNIALQYDSSVATSEHPVGRSTGYYIKRYDIWAYFVRITPQEANAIQNGNIALAESIANIAWASGNYFDEKVGYTDGDNIDHDVAELNFPYINDWFFYGNYYLHIYAYPVYRNTDFVATGTINIVTALTGENPMSYMGDGWSLKFDTIISNGADDIILKFGDGSAYRYMKGVSASNLKNYPLSDIKLEEAANAYKASKYTLSFKDGKKEYFDSSGHLLGIRDRFNNTIDFTYTINSSYNGNIVITDTDGKITNIVFTPANVTFILPDSTMIKYTLESWAKGKVMTQKLDQLNRTTIFSYSALTADFDFFTTNISSPNKLSVTYNLLTDITYSTGAITHFQYAAAISNTTIETLSGYAHGFAIYYRLISRQDLADSVTYNHVQYTYSTNNFSGYPSAGDMDNLNSSFTYTITAAWDDTTEKMYTFNNKHLNTIIDVKCNNTQKMLSTYVFDSSKQLDTLTNQVIGAVTQTTNEFYTFDIQGNLTAYWDRQAGGKDDMEHKRTYTYDSRFALLLDETYKRDSATTILNGNTLSNDGKSVSTSKYYVNGNLSSQVDFTYDTYGNIIAKTSYVSPSKLIVTAYTYSGGVHLSSESKGGITLTYTYDVMGRRLTSKDGNGFQTSNLYDAIGRIVQIINPDNSAAQNTYDDIALTMISQNEIGLKLKTIYDKLGNVKQIQDVTSTTVTLETKAYDTFLRLSSHTDARGTVTTYTYDYLDRMLTKVIGGSAYQETYIYDDAINVTTSRVLKIIEGEANAPSVKTVKYTNIYGFVEKDGRVIDNIEQVSSFTYDYLGNQLTSKTPDNITTAFQYDGSNRLIKTLNPDSGVYQQAFDWLGRKTSATDPKGAVSIFTYDDADRLIQEEIPFEGIYSTVKNYFYDNNNNITSQRVSNNEPGMPVSQSRTDFEYNNRNFLTRVNRFNNNIIEYYVVYAYDNVGNKLAVSAANATQTTSYLHDKRSRLVTLTDPIGNFETYTYDDNNNLLTKKDRAKTIITNGYDALNRLISVTATNSNGSYAAEYILYSYYKTGTRKQEKNESLTTDLFMIPRGG